MRYRIAAVLLLLFAAHGLKGVADTLQFHYDASPYAGFGDEAFWNPDESWKAKYAREADGEPVRPLREAFPGSSTVFVGLTDAWHLSQGLQYACIRLAICLLLVPQLGWRGLGAYLGVFVGLWLVQGMGFWVFYY